MAVQTDDATLTVVAQRGVVTAIDATSVTVKSTDGFTLTWIFGSPITVKGTTTRFPSRCETRHCSRPGTLTTMPRRSEAQS